MNAPANIPSIGPAWQRYAAVVDALVPGCCDIERQCRARIMYARDEAIRVRQKGVGWAASNVLSNVEQLGIAYATASLPPYDLETIRRSMAELFRIAGALDIAGGAQ